MSVKDEIIPISVNFFYSRACNYHCGYCFHAENNLDKLPLEQVKKGLSLLRNKGMKKINFSGGEPFIFADDFLGPIIRYCKLELHLEYISIISNGSLIKERWLNQFGKYIDLLGISCDSFVPSTNKKIGRGNGEVVNFIFDIREWCYNYDINFKVNTVVNTFNWQEDMNEHIARLNPHRWKCFQTLIIDGENSGVDRQGRDGKLFYVDEHRFRHFIEVHKNQVSLVIEENDVMRNSYLLVDENMCFLNCADGGKKPTKSILEVGVEKALLESGYDEGAFQERGGAYFLKEIQI